MRIFLLFQVAGSASVSHFWADKLDDPAVLNYLSALIFELPPLNQVPTEKYPL
jgi:hypothetical protein